jgi:hypothetical protein
MISKHNVFINLADFQFLVNVLYAEIQTLPSAATRAASGQAWLVVVRRLQRSTDDGKESRPLG